MKLDILVLAAHPDDAELGCGGTIARHVALGYKVGVVDFTRGELGTRGTPQTRDREAAEAAVILGLSARENLALRDGFFGHSESEVLKVIEAIRHYRPDVVLANAIHDRHPDHGKGAGLAYEAAFLSGLPKIETKRAGTAQQPWRPGRLYHYIQSRFIKPHFVVDVSDCWDTKMNAIKAYKTQFFDPDSTEPETYISKPTFLSFLQSRAEEFGHSIGTKYGEGFTTTQMLGIDDLFSVR